MAYNRFTKWYETLNKGVWVNSQQYSPEEKKKMIRDAGYTGFQKWYENLSDQQFLDLFYRQGPNWKMAIKTNLADKYFTKEKPGERIAVNATKENVNIEPNVTPAPGTYQAELDAFNEGINRYKWAELGAIDLLTQRGRLDFDEKRKDLETKMARYKEDYAKFTSRAQMDYNRNLAASDKQFARKLANAASAYGKRGLINSGVFAQNQSEMTGDFMEDQSVYKLNFDRKLSDADTERVRTEEDFGRDISWLERKSDYFEQDQSAKRDIKGIEIERQADDLWNQTQESMRRVNADLSQQQSKDTSYGRTGTSRLPVYRRGGKISI